MSDTGLYIKHSPGQERAPRNRAYTVEELKNLPPNEFARKLRSGITVVV